MVDPVVAPCNQVVGGPLCVQRECCGGLWLSRNVDCAAPVEVACGRAAMWIVRRRLRWHMDVPPCGLRGAGCGGMWMCRNVNCTAPGLVDGR